MAIYRSVQMSFWTDTKIADDFSAEEKLMYLYLITNPHTNLCGCYEISIKQMALEIGQTPEKTRKILGELQNRHRVIVYSNETKEVLLVNWHKYNWTTSEKFVKPLLREIDAIKCEEFKAYLTGVFNKDTVSIPYLYGSDTTVTVTDTVNTVVDTKEDLAVKQGDPAYEYEAIIDYLNQKAGTSFRSKSRDTRAHIRARYEEGYKTDDFLTVIDKKVSEWKGTDMAKFLRPQTLFGTKFESYLNQREESTAKGYTGSSGTRNFDNFTPSGTDWDAVADQLFANC